MVTLASEPDGFEHTRDRRARVDRPRPASACDAGPLRADADVAARRPRPGPARALRRRRAGGRAARSARSARRRWSPGSASTGRRTCSARASPARFGDALAGRRARLRREELGRRVRRPLVVGPGPEGVAFAGGRIHGVAPTAVVAWTPDGLVTLAPPFARTVARAGGGEWHIRATSPRWRVEIEGEATRRRCGSRPAPDGAPARAPLQPPPARARSRVARATAAGACGCARVGAGGPRGRRRQRVVHDQQRDVVLAARRRARASRSTWSQTASGGSWTSSSARRSSSRPSSIGRVRSSISPSV